MVSLDFVLEIIVIPKGVIGLVFGIISMSKIDKLE
jgi:hypothetical protein